MSQTIIYLRVSLSKQETAAQLAACQEYLGTDTYTVLQDEGISGTTMDRPAVKNLLSQVRQGKVSKLVVFEPSRISRNMLELGLFLQTCQAAGVEVHSVSTGGLMKFGGAEEQIVQMLHGLTAQLERQRISDRTRAGMARARAAGKRLGARPGERRKLGYRKTYCPELTAKVVSARQAGVSWRKIEELLGISQATARRIFHRGV